MTSSFNLPLFFYNCYIKLLYIRYCNFITKFFWMSFIWHSPLNLLYFCIISITNTVHINCITNLYSCITILRQLNIYYNIFIYFNTSQRIILIMQYECSKSGLSKCVKTERHINLTLKELRYYTAKRRVAQQRYCESA